MSQPIRIQCKRTPGWTMPPNTVYVGRPTMWGNPYRVSRDGNGWCIARAYGPYKAKEDANLQAVMFFRKAFVSLSLKDRAALLAPLRGKNLACWCPLDQPCHADVLLKLANQEAKP